jgi:hypothetical protein
MKIFLLCLLASISMMTLADRQNGEISGLVAYESGGKKMLFFKIVGAAPAACNTTARFVIDSASKINFDLMSSTILSAYHSKTPVQVEYNQTCNTWGNSFDARYICVGDIAC